MSNSNRHANEVHAPSLQGVATRRDFLQGALVGAASALCGPLLGGYIASINVDTRWNFYAFACVALIAAVATALIPNKPATGDPPRP